MSSRRRHWFIRLVARSGVRLMKNPSQKGVHAPLTLLTTDEKLARYDRILPKKTL
ncbi:hypothetical protein CCP3SC1AL1_2740002 [Gammaproteobacteria bacterium]